MKKLLLAALMAVAPFASATVVGDTAPAPAASDYDMVFEAKKGGLTVESRRGLLEMRPSFYSSCSDTPATKEKPAQKACESLQFNVMDITTQVGSAVLEIALKVEMWTTIDNIVTERRTLESRGALVPDQPWVQSDGTGTLQVSLKPRVTGK